MAAGHKVQIRITGFQYPAGVGVDEEPVVTIQEVETEYFQKGESHYLFYEEQQEGFPSPLKTRVKRKGETLEIHRQGLGGSTMFFAPGQTYRTEYSTPYGKLLLDIVTSKVTVQKNQSETDFWPEVVVEYELCSDGETLGSYRIVIGQSKR